MKHYWGMMSFLATVFSLCLMSLAIEWGSLGPGFVAMGSGYFAGYAHAREHMRTGGD